MNVFISWSGERSEAVAEALRRFLEDVIQAVKPFMSAADIEAGAAWAETLRTKLESTDFGILCLTPENLDSPWILFEAGALSKAVDKAHVCPYLLELSATDLKWPLAQFNANLADRDGTWKIVQAINEAMKKDGLSEKQLERAFARCCPELSKTLAKVPDVAEKKKPGRTDRELLEEVLELLRGQARARSSVFSGHPVRGGYRPRFVPEKVVLSADRPPAPAWSLEGRDVIVVGSAGPPDEDSSQASDQEE